MPNGRDPDGVSHLRTFEPCSISFKAFQDHSSIRISNLATVWYGIGDPFYKRSPNKKYFSFRDEWIMCSNANPNHNTNPNINANPNPKPTTDPN